MKQPVVLWWSRGSRDYSRDRIVRQSFVELGWEIQDFCPRISRLGRLQAAWQQIPRPDLVWVPCFRQRDVSAAAAWARKHNVPLIFDPLISAWDKQVFERQKFAATSWRAARLKRWEGSLLRRSAAVVADTRPHALFFERSFDLLARRIAVIPVSAEEDVFKPQAPNPPRRRPQVLFYGSFIGLQGPQWIATAAASTPEVDWRFIGSGPCLEQCRQICQKQPNVEFLSRIPYDTLPEQIGAADILLGVFGTSQKAGRVIPNKAYQALACGRPLVTRQSDAYPEPLQRGTWPHTGLRFVEPGSAAAVVDAVRELASGRDRLPDAGRAARQTFEQHFSNAMVRQDLATLLKQVLKQNG